MIKVRGLRIHLTCNLSIKMLFIFFYVFLLNQISYHRLEIMPEN